MSLRKKIDGYCVRPKMRDRPEVVEFLVQTGNASVDGEFSRTPLHMAAWFNTLPVVEFLVQTGNASVDARDKSSRTPLHSAARSNTLPVVRFLVEQAKSNVNAETSYSNTPLDLAKKYNKKNPSVYKYLSCIRNNLLNSHFPDGVMIKESTVCDDENL